MPFWSVVRSLPMKERFAASQLELRGFETFLPLVATKRASQPLFASYFFVRIVEQWRSINFCFGVLGLVRVGECPSKMPDSEIENLKSMIVGGFVRLPEAPAAPVGRKIAIGAKVRITGGAFGGMSGLYAGQSTRERELVQADNALCQSPPAWSRQYDTGDARPTAAPARSDRRHRSDRRRRQGAGAHRSPSRASRGGLGRDRRSGRAQTIGDR
jgi:transcription antitermination factor NusG